MSMLFTGSKENNKFGSIERNKQKRPCKICMVLLDDLLLIDKEIQEKKNEP
jgi:hypothetical protein